jgi:hypothetical protein
MASRTLELTNALASWIAALHASSPFPAAIAPLVLWVHKYDKRDLAAVKFSVVPGPIEMQPLGRAGVIAGGQRIAHKREIDLVTQQNVDPSDLADVDPLVELQEELVARIAGTEISTASGQGATCTAAEMITADKAAVDKAELQNLRVFTAVLRTSWSFKR